VSAVVSSEGSGSDDESVDDSTISSGDSQLVIHHSSNSISYSSSSTSNNSFESSCSCTNNLYHLLMCPVPLSKRVSLHFTSPSSVLPRQQCSFSIENVLSQRINSLPNASDAQKQLINTGSSAARANCLLKQDVWSSLLGGYVPSDTCYTSYVLVAGMKHGCYVRYEGNRTESVSKRNHPDARKHPHELLQLVLQELCLGRVIGPFSVNSPPFAHLKICPLNIVPKCEKKWRLIQDLSSPQHRSVNDGILHMPTDWQLIDDALQLIYDAGRGCHLVKMDVKSAYRQLPIHPDDWHLFGFVCEDLLFIDTYLPFGCRSSGCIWERYAQAAQWILSRHYGIHRTARWVDDFLFIFDENTSDAQVKVARKAFDDIGMPMDPSKEVGPSTELTYIGYLINTSDFTIGVPAEKRESTLQLLEINMSCRKISVEALESLIGKLQFNEKAVRKGRSYLYALRKQLVRAQKASAQSWHRIKFSSDAKHELKWWHNALQHDSKVSLLHYVKWSDPLGVLEPSSDASEWGCGAYFNGEYISLPWSDETKVIARLGTRHRSMPLCEAIGVAVAISTWRHQFAGRQVLFRTDCLPVAHGINKGRSKSTSSEWQNAVYRFINRTCHRHNIFLRAEHIKGTDNVLSDFVSRNMEHEFLQQSQQENRVVTRAQVLPVTLQPSLNTPAIFFPSA
jgi:hypothetical protein